MKIIYLSVYRCALWCLLTLAATAPAAWAQTGVFTYQGRLTDTGTGSATYDLQFALDNNATLLTCNGAATTNNVCENVPVTNGVFTVRLDFGAAAFDGTNRTLQIGVRRGTETGAFTTLAPNQPITSTPYTIQSLNAANSANLGGVAAANYLQTTGSGANLTNLNAANIASGTLDDARLSANVARRDQANTFAAAQIVNGNLTQIGTTADLYLTNGFVTRGRFSTGAIPATGGGVRMMFYPNKAAFRAGLVSATLWDDANIGDFSIALGYDVGATQRAAFAAGEGTLASGNNSTALGLNTTASGNSSTALGYFATASGNFSTAIGRATIASGNYSIALGQSASTNSQQGSFVYGDNSPSGFLHASAENQFNVRAAGGYRLFSNAGLTTGVTLSAGGGAWTTISDRNAKENFAAVNSRDVLRRVLNLPISTWSYKGQSYRHIGATAQDFYKAFEVGENDTTITTVDPDGVALAAIQGLNEELTEQTAKLNEQLNERTKKLQTELEKQRAENDALKEQMRQQQERTGELERIVCALKPDANICQ